MNSQRSVEEWRQALRSQEIKQYLDFLETLAPRTKTERMLKLKSQFSNIAPDIATIALETILIREQLETSSDWARNAFFLQSRKEQSTRPEIAQHHAQQFTDLSVLEIGCGIGFDTAALARAAQHVTALDTDARCCAIAEYNLALQEIHNVTIIHSSFADYQETHSLDVFNAIWADPGRRSDDGERIHNPDLYHPPLNSILTIAFSGLIGIKVSPALNIWELTPEWSHELIGWEWGCPEQVLWKNSSLPARQASLVDAHVNWHKQYEECADNNSNSIESGQFLLEPHPALVRTNECEFFYKEQNIALLDPHLSFGISSEMPPSSPWLRTYQVKESFRYTLKSLKQRLKELGWDSRTQIKKRGLREQPDEIHRALKLPAPERDSPWGFVILLKIEDSPLAILAERIR